MLHKSRIGIQAAMMMGLEMMRPDEVMSPKGREYEPEPLTKEQKEQMVKDVRQIDPLHRFVIRGKEYWARNRKAALKQANGR